VDLVSLWTGQLLEIGSKAVKKIDKVSLENLETITDL